MFTSVKADFYFKDDSSNNVNCYKRMSVFWESGFLQFQ